MSQVLVSLSVHKFMKSLGAYAPKNSQMNLGSLTILYAASECSTVYSFIRTHKVGPSSLP